jgi:hypothetical protein
MRHQIYHQMMPIFTQTPASSQRLGQHLANTLPPIRQIDAKGGLQLGCVEP